MPFVTADDGAADLLQGLGRRRHAGVLSHGWPLNSDAWEAAALFLAEHGHRAIAHDRRGHGRSSQTWHGNEMDTYADDLACLIDTLDLRDLTLVGHSTGGGEIVHYVGRHGTDRVARLVLVSAVPPLMLRTDDNPEGLPLEAFDEIRAGRSPTARSSTATWPTDRSSATTATTTSSQGVRDAFWLQSMACGHRGAYECIAAFSATDFRPDLAQDRRSHPGHPRRRRPDRARSRSAASAPPSWSTARC